MRFLLGLITAIYSFHSPAAGQNQQQFQRVSDATGLKIPRYKFNFDVPATKSGKIHPLVSPVKPFKLKSQPEPEPKAEKNPYLKEYDTRLLLFLLGTKRAKLGTIAQGLEYVDRKNTHHYNWETGRIMPTDLRGWVLAAPACIAKGRCYRLRYNSETGKRIRLRSRRSTFARQVRKCRRQGFKVPYFDCLHVSSGRGNLAAGGGLHGMTMQANSESEEARKERRQRQQAERRAIRSCSTLYTKIRALGYRKRLKRSCRRLRGL